MKKLIPVLIFLALSGCFYNTSPTLTVESAASALNDGDLETFDALLLEPAKDKLGNPQAFAELRARFAGANLNVGGAELIPAHDACGSRCTSKYYVPVLSGGAIVMRVWVTCIDTTTHTKENEFTDHECYITDAQ